MDTVGVRELKSNLSRYLKLEDKLLQMAGQGLIHWSGSKPIGIKNRINSSGGKVSEAVLEDRR